LIQRRGPAPVATALELGKQIALALSFAHQQGLVHRDVKPQNVLLNGDGAAKVTDFGIARSLDVKHGMTQTGTVLGTSDYIAPEQAQGQNVDEQTDIYSLGVVLYEMLTAEVPFPGESFVAVAMRHINEPPPPIRDKRPDVSPRVEAAVQRAMAKDPRDRFASMADFAAELDACLAELSTEQHTVAAPSVARRRSGPSPWPVVLALVLLIAIGAGIGYWALHRHSPAGNGHAPSLGSSGAEVHLTAVTAYDPQGDGHENNGEVANATDQSPATYWETEHYRSSLASLGKQGVGIVLRVPQAMKLSQLGIATATPGFRAQIQAGSSPTGPFSPVSQDIVVGGQQRFSLTVSSSEQYYLVWITQLPPGQPSARINDVTATSG
jgi:serine/threonine-protein kinase